MKSVSLKTLKMLREKNSLTQLEVSLVLGYESSLGYHYLEKGRSEISANQVAILANLYKVGIDELYSEDKVDNMATGTEG